MEVCTLYIFGCVFSFKKNKVKVVFHSRFQALISLKHLLGHLIQIKFIKSYIVISTRFIPVELLLCSWADRTHGGAVVLLFNHGGNWSRSHAVARPTHARAHTLNDWMFLCCGDTFTPLLFWGWSVSLLGSQVIIKLYLWLLVIISLLKSPISNIDTLSDIYDTPFISEVTLSSFLHCIKISVKGYMLILRLLDPKLILIDLKSIISLLDT